MNNSQIFTAAHKMARQFKAIVGNYAVAFKWALDTIYARIRAAKKTITLRAGRNAAEIDAITMSALKKIERHLTPQSSRVAQRFFSLMASGMSFNDARVRVVNCDADKVVVDKIVSVW